MDSAKKFSLYANVKQPDYDVCVQAQIQNPELGVIIPVFNIAPQYLAECFSCLESQRADSIEWIFVDDHSSDDSLDRLCDFALNKHNVSVLHMKHNMRQGAARNRGIDFSRSNYIGFMDPDDSITDDFYSSLLTVANDTQADLIASSYKVTDEDLHPISTVVKPFHDVILRSGELKSRKQLMHEEFIICCCIYRKSLLDQPGCHFPEQVLFEDNPTKSQWKANVMHMERVEKGCYFWRKHPASTCNSAAVRMDSIEDRLKTAQMIIDNAKQYNYYDMFADEVQWNYGKLYLYNTLTILAHDGTAQTRKLARPVARTARMYLGRQFSHNKYYKALPLVGRVGWQLALYFPRLFMTIAKRMRQA